VRILCIVFVGFKEFLIGSMMASVEEFLKLSKTHKGDHPMHDLLIALAFIGMVVAPAVVAAKSGKSEVNLD
jgi:hypothetical protein